LVRNAVNTSTISTLSQQESVQYVLCELENLVVLQIHEEGLQDFRFQGMYTDKV